MSVEAGSEDKTVTRTSEETERTMSRASKISNIIDIGYPSIQEKLSVTFGEL